MLWKGCENVSLTFLMQGLNGTGTVSGLVLAQPEMEKRRSPLVSIPPFRAGIFKAWGLSIRWGFGRRKNGVLTPPFIVSMSPPGYPSAWLRPRSARFRFARQIIVARNDLPFLNIRFARDHPTK